MENIELKKMGRSERVLTFDFDYPADLDPVFNHSKLRFEYDTDISTVPDSIAVIPYVGNLAPVAWAYDIELAIPEIGQRFKRTLEEVRTILDRLYPEIGFVGMGGGIEAETTIEWGGGQVGSSKTGQLFTGGLDSITTYVRHHDESPKLVTVKKRENAYNGQWDRAEELLSGFADRNDVDWSSISTNSYYLMDHSYLEAQFPESLPTSSWWANLHAGLSHLATCSPLAVAEGLDTMLMASTHTNDFEQPWSTDPRIINKIAWGKTECFNDGYELTRQEKWQTVIDHFEPRGGVHVQSCLTPGNCNSTECRKCARNIVALALEGADTEKYGYSIPNNYFKGVRENFETGRWRLSANNLFFWEDIQDHIPDDINSADLPDSSMDFFSWLASEDLEKYVHS